MIKIIKYHLLTKAVDIKPFSCKSLLDDIHSRVLPRARDVAKRDGGLMHHHNCADL